MSKPISPPRGTIGTTPEGRYFRPAKCGDCGLARDIGGFVPVEGYRTRHDGVIILCLGCLATRRWASKGSQRLARVAERVVSTYPTPDGAN